MPELAASVAVYYDDFFEMGRNWEKFILRR